MEGREDASIEQIYDISNQNVAYIPVSKFNHPTQKYAMFAFVAAIVVAIGGFLLGIGDTSYQIMTFGAFGCCGLVNLALILYVIGTGPVKGFAITLSIGIITSMFTAIMCTRAIVNLVYGNKNIKELKI